MSPTNIKPDSNFSNPSSTSFPRLVPATGFNVSSELNV